MTTEKQVYEAVCHLYRSVGCEVYRFSQARASQQTPGIPDLLVYMLRQPRVAFFHEVKTPKGRPSLAQERHKALADMCGIHVVVGGVAEAVAYLQSLDVRIGATA